jgi:hypothetical protein
MSFEPGISPADRARIAAYIDNQLHALRTLTQERKTREIREARETKERRQMEYVIQPERLAKARKIVRERLRVMDIDELTSFMETVEWEHRLYFEGNGVPKLRLSDLEIVMLAAGLLAVSEMEYEKRAENEGLPPVRRGDNPSLDSIPF